MTFTRLPRQSREKAAAALSGGRSRLAFQYLDRHGSVAPRLCDSGVRAWVIVGENDDVGLTGDARDELESCPQVTLETIPGTGDFTLNTHRGRISALINEAISAAEKAPTPRASSSGSANAD
jgi:pimeloyl-ACP methyl ester carboxylesterase